MNLLTFKKMSIILAVVALSGSQLLGDTTFTFQAELKANGNSANGTFPMEFSLWDTAVLGTQIGSPINQNVQVTNGRFTVELDFGEAVWSESGRWLETKVNGTTLDPRSKVTRAPYSIQTRGIFVNESEQVGIGTNSPQAQLHIDGTGTSDVILHLQAPGSSTGDIQFGSPQGHVGLAAFANNGNRRDIRFMDSGMGFFTRNSPSSPASGNGIFINESGKVGIGTTTPATVLDVVGDARADTLRADELFLSGDGTSTLMNLNNGGGANQTNTALIIGSVVGNGRAASFYGITSQTLMRVHNDGSGNAADFIGDVSVAGGRLITPVLQITGGSDFSEMFDVGGDVETQPGMVVVIDPDHPGRLVPCETPYDRKVAGIISGAGGVATGMTMGHQGTIADGQHPVALTGRVYCLVNATSGAIEPGDRLTTSSTPGHAMKADNLDAANGAIIGKAMTALAQGETGLVLVLVNLQ